MAGARPQHNDRKRRFRQTVEDVSNRRVYTLHGNAEHAESVSASGSAVQTLKGADPPPSRQSSGTAMPVRPLHAELHSVGAS
eukprot:155396-Chlamydomonas_euryale.AAC.8